MNTRKLICFVTLAAGLAILTTSKILSRKLVNNYKRPLVLQQDGEADFYYQIKSSDNNGTECRNRTIDEFPPDFLTLKQKQHGGVIIHILITIYVFCAVSIVCDEYFVHSLNRIAKGLFFMLPL